MDSLVTRRRESLQARFGGAHGDVRHSVKQILQPLSFIAGRVQKGEREGKYEGSVLPASIFLFSLTHNSAIHFNGRHVGSISCAALKTFAYDFFKSPFYSNWMETLLPGH